MYNIHCISAAIQPHDCIQHAEIQFEDDNQDEQLENDSQFIDPRVGLNLVNWLLI